MPRTILATSSAFDAAKMMKEQGATALAVVSHDGSLAGLVSEQDLVRRLLLRGLDKKATKLETIMTKGVEFASISEVNDDIVAVQAKMMRLGVKHIPIIRRIDSAKHTVIDCLDIRNVVRLIRNQQEGEAAAATGGSGWGSIGSSLVSSISNIGALLGLQAAKSAAAEKDGRTRSGSTGTDGYHKSSGALVMASDSSIIDCAKAMAKRRCTAVVLHEPSDEGLICGIITVHDIVKKVIAADHEVDLMEPVHLSSMTWDPLLLLEQEAAVDKALEAMNKHGFRHLPVVKLLKSRAPLRPKAAGSTAGPSADHVPATTASGSHSGARGVRGLFSPLKRKSQGSPAVEFDSSVAGEESAIARLDMEGSQRVRVLFVYDYVTALQVMLGLPAVTKASTVDVACEDAEDEAMRKLDQRGAALLLSPKRAPRGSGGEEGGAAGGAASGGASAATVSEVSVVVQESVVLRLGKVCESIRQTKDLIAADRFGEAVDKLRRPLLRLDMLCRAGEREHGEHKSQESAVLLSACLSVRVQSHSLQAALSAITRSGEGTSSKAIEHLSKAMKDMARLDTLCHGTYKMAGSVATGSCAGAGALEVPSSLRPGAAVRLVPDSSDAEGSSSLELHLPPLHVIPSCMEQLSQQQTAAGSYSDAASTILSCVAWTGAVRGSIMSTIGRSGRADASTAVKKGEDIASTELRRLIVAGKERIEYCRDAIRPAFGRLFGAGAAAMDSDALDESTCRQVDEMLMGVNAISMALGVVSKHPMCGDPAVRSALSAACSVDPEVMASYSSDQVRRMVSLIVDSCETAGMQALVVGIRASRAALAAADRTSSRLLEQTAASMAKMQRSAVARCEEQALSWLAPGKRVPYDAPRSGAAAALLAIGAARLREGRAVEAATAAGMGMGALSLSSGGQVDRHAAAAALGCPAQTVPGIAHGNSVSSQDSADPWVAAVGAALGMVAARATKCIGQGAPAAPGAQHRDGQALGPASPTKGSAKAVDPSGAQLQELDDIMAAMMQGQGKGAEQSSPGGMKTGL